MPFSDITNNIVTLIKSDGTTFPGIKASVQKKKIFIDGNKILIETGDHIEHEMSNGGKDIYEVIDPGFHEAFAGLEPHYQIDVRKMGVPEARSFQQHITYNISGNGRVNNSSVDQSVNFSSSPEMIDTLKKLRNAIEKENLESSAKTSSLEIVASVENQLQQDKPSKAVVLALLSALPKVANIATIINTMVSLAQKL